MKKKTVKQISVLLTAALLAFSSAGCGNSADTDQDTATEESSVAADAEEDEAEDSSQVEVDEGLLTVEITIPADYLGEDITQEDLDQAKEEKGYVSATLNEDGSATYVMTKNQHREMMQEMSDSLESTLNEMVGSEDYPNITAITHNDNYTSFTVTTNNTEVDMAESFMAYGLYMYGGIYNSYNGTTVDNIHVDYVNADSGEIISSADSKDLADSE